MPIAKTIHKWERVVPVRFARAPHLTDPTISSGTYDANAPEPDDRGFLPHAVGGAVLPIGLDESILDVNSRPESRVRLIRMNMEDAGQLFVTSSNPAVFVITLPAAGSVLPSAKEMMIKMRAVASGTANLEVRFGSIGGPIIHQMQVVVNPLISVRVVAHVPTINGNVVINPAPPPAGAPFPTPQGTAFPAQAARTDASIRDMINNANIIYFPYGIKLNLDAAIDRAGVLNNFQNQGMVDDLSNEFDLTTNPPAATQPNGPVRVPNAINVYFVPQIANTLGNNPINQTAGVATSAKTNPRTYGLFIPDWTVNFQSIAHEIGHLFNIVNDPTNEFLHINTRVDNTIPGTGKVVRFDTISRRRLMWAFTGVTLGNTTAEPTRSLHNLPFRSDVGYGLDAVGGLLTIKQLDNDKTDLEMKEVRRTSAALP